MQAVYGRQADSGLISRVRKGQEPSAPKDADPELVANLLEAEASVPTSLSCHAEVTGAKPIKKEVKNDINYGKLNSYSLKASSKTEFSLSDIAEQPDRKNALENLKKLEGVDDKIAGKIYDRLSCLEQRTAQLLGLIH